MPRKKQSSKPPVATNLDDANELIGALWDRLNDLEDRLNQGQMGNNLLAYVAMQSGQFHQSISKIQQQLEQNFGLSFSRGAISEAQGRVSSVLTPAYQDIKETMRTEAVVHCDETRYQRGNENRWMWQVCTAELSCFMGF